MKQYPELWRIDDWDQPWLPWYIRLLNRIPKSLLDKYVPLETEAALTRARRATGLSNFGSTDFLEPLNVFLDSIKQSDQLSSMGHLTVYGVLKMQLEGRLCVENLVQQNPRITGLPVKSPIIIAGLPRTGTTHLHNLLSQVRGLRFIPYWQTLSPVSSPKHKSYAASVAARRRQHRISIFCATDIVPLFKRMHEMELDMPHEELTLTALCLRSFVYEGLFEVQRYRAWYAAQDNTIAYQYLRKILQAIQFETAPNGESMDRRWVLKSPQHLDQLPAIGRAFPDVKVVRTHRDPARAVLSLITMILYCRRQTYYPGNRLREARAWVDRLEQMLRKFVHRTPEIPSGNVMDLHFDEFMQDQEGTIRKVLAFADVEYDAHSAQAVQAHLQSHTRDRHGRIDYRFEDLGLDENEVRERFSFYSP